MSALPIQLKRAIDQTVSLVDPDLINGWLRDALRDQAEPDEMVESLIRMGYPSELSSLMVGLSQKGLFIGQGQGIDPRMVSRSKLGTPDVPHAVDHWGEGGDGAVRKVVSTGKGNLEVIVYDQFITEAEAEYMREAVRHRLERSSVVGPGFSNLTHQARTSSGAFIDVGAHPLVAALEARIARVTGLPVNHGEAFQILHYGHTEQYQPHYDFFEPDNAADKANLNASGNRVGTMLFYLSEVTKGGATYFPKLDLAVHPKPGQALWFRYLDADGKVDYRSEHAGLPVIEGEKWVATKWLRERPIAQPPVLQWAHEGQVVDVGAPPPVLNPGAHLTVVK
jgi:prolyl 4-hydroxylase